MVRELSELLADSVDARARSVSGLTPDADDYSTIVRTVRRRRVVRHSLQTLAVVPLVGGLAAGAYFGLGALQSAPIDPAATPTVTTPAPPVQELEKGELLSEPGLPPFFEAPADLASHVGAGWAALTYRPVAASDSTGVAQEPAANAVLLVSPEGETFRTATFEPDLDVTLLFWDAASEKARVQWTGGSDRLLTVGWLDVYTGALTEDAEQFAQWANFLGYSDAGTELWVEDPAEGQSQVTVWSIGPDGSRRTVASLDAQGVPTIDPAGRALLTEGGDPASGFAVVDIDSGDVREVPFGMPGQTCVVVGWLDATSVAALCHDPVSDDAVAAMDRVDYVAQNAALYRVETVADGGTSQLHVFAEGEPVPEPWTGFSTGADSLAYVVSNGFPGGCSLGVAAWDGATVRSVLGAGEHGSNIFLLQPGGAGQVLVTGSQSCESSGVQGEVTLVDAVGGTASVLTPWVEAAPQDGVDYWHHTVSSAVVAS